MSEDSREPEGKSLARPSRDARQDALRWLSRRPLTDAEIRTRLAARGHETSVIESALAALHDGGWIDDAALALDYILARGPRLGHGRCRLLRELRHRGVDPEVADRAWRIAIDSGDLDPEELLDREIAKQVGRCGGRLGPRDYRRVYNALLRGGHDAGSVVAGLRPYRCHPDSDEA